MTQYDDGYDPPGSETNPLIAESRWDMEIGPGGPVCTPINRFYGLGTAYMAKIAQSSPRHAAIVQNILRNGIERAGREVIVFDTPDQIEWALKCARECRDAYRTAYQNALDARRPPTDVLQ